MNTSSQAIIYWVRVGKRPFLLFSLIFLLFFPSAITAASNRYVAPIGSDTNNDCSNPDTPCATIRHAIEESNDGNTIHLAIGIYTETNMVISDTLSIIGESQTQTILQAHSDPQQATGVIFTTYGGLTLENFTIRHAGNGAVSQADAGMPFHADQMIFRNFNGTGIYLQLANALVTSTTFEATGAGIFGQYNTRLVVSNSRFIGNGSGIVMSEETYLTVTDSFFSSNGTGIANYDGEATIIKCIVTHNYMGVYHTNDDYVLRVQDSQITYNQDRGISSNHGTFVVDGSTIAGNGGGGIYLDSQSSMYLLNSTVSGNFAATNGGGIHNDGDLTIDNSTISGNKTNLSGGGIYSSGANGYVRLNNVTITKNIADFDRNNTGDGGGVYDESGDFALQNSIIAGNRDGGSLTGSHDCSGTLISQNYNLIQTMTGCLLTGATDHNVIGVSPLLGQLANNGGLTKTHVLLVSSPVINAGNPAVPGSGGFACELADQRGELRDAFCDIGAFEVK